MADNLESIGGVKVDIRGDFSDLPADFEAAIKIAVDSGHTLAEAIAMATKAPDTTAAQTAIGKIADSAEQAGAQLDLFGKAVDGIPFADASGQLNIFTDELETFKGASQTAAEAAAQLEKGITAAGEASGHAEISFHHFADSVGEFIENPLKTAGAGLGSFVEALGPAGLAVGAFAGAALIAGKEIYELVTEEAAAARETQNLAYRLNLTFEETKQLSDMATVAGVNIDVLARVSMRLADAMNDSTGAGKKVAAALESIGVVTSDSGEALKQMLEKLAEIPEATERISKAHEIMGRGAVQLEPLLRNYEALQAAVEQLGGQLDEKMVASLLKANESSKLLGVAWDHLKESLAATFAPAVTAGLEILTRLLTKPPEDTLPKQIENLTENILQLKFATQGAVVASDMLNESMGQLGSTTTAGMIAAKEAQLEQLKGLAEAQQRSKEYNEDLNQSNRANQKWAADNKAALEDMNKAAIAFNNSVVGLYNTFPETYAEYASKLEEGGKTAKSTMDTLSASIDKATSLTVSLRGQPLKDIQDWIVALKEMRQTAQDFADTDAFLKASTKIAALTDKFPEQINELKLLGVGFIEFFDRMETVAANKPVSKGWEVDIELIKRDLEVRKQFDDQAQKLERTLTRGWETYEVAARKAAGVTSDVKQALNDLEPDWTKLWATFPEGVQQAYASSMELRSALKALGYDLDADQGKAIALFDKVAKNGDASLKEIEFAWGRVSGQIAKLAKTDLPSAIAEFDKYIKDLKEAGAAVGYIYQLEEQRLNLEIKDAELRGKDATAQLIHLENIKIAQQILIDQSSLLGDMYIGLMKDFDNAFGAFSKGIADNIIDAKNWGDVFTGIIDGIAKQILNTLIGTAFKALEDTLLKHTKLLQDMAGLATGAMSKVTKALGLGGAAGKIPLGGGGGAAASSGSGEVAQEGSALPSGGAPDLSGEASGVGGAVSKSGGGGMSPGSFGGVMSIASLGVSIATGISQGIQNSRMINLLGEIEISTRQVKEQLVGGVQPTLNTYLPELKHLTDIWGELANGTLAQIRDVLWWGIVNVNVAGTGGSGSLGFDPRNTTWAKGEQDKRNEAAQHDQAAATEEQTGASQALTSTTELATNSLRNLHDTALKSTTALQQHVEATAAATAVVEKANAGPAFSGTDQGVARMSQKDALDYLAKALKEGTYTSSNDGGLAALAKHYGITPEAAKAIVDAQKPMFDAMLAKDQTHLANIAEGQASIDRLTREMAARSNQDNNPQATAIAAALNASAQAQAALIGSTRSLEATIGLWQSQFLAQSVGRDPQATAAASAALTQQINDAIAKAGLGGIAKVQGYAGSYGGTGAFSSGTILQRPDFTVSTPSTGFTSPSIPSAPAQMATITVNAVNPSSRGVTQALVDGMQQAGLRVK